MLHEHLHSRKILCILFVLSESLFILTDFSGGDSVVDFMGEVLGFTTKVKY